MTSCHTSKLESLHAAFKARHGMQLIGSLRASSKPSLLSILRKSKHPKRYKDTNHICLRMHVGCHIHVLLPTPPVHQLACMADVLLHSFNTCLPCGF